MDRFWSKVEKTPGCWLWKAARSSRYGMFRLIAGETMKKAHRVAWMLTNGRPIPDGQCILHKCDNTFCVNPEHLFLGTQADNIEDCRRKGRNSHGEKHRSAKLTEDQVRQIRSLLSQGRSQRSLAKQYGISHMSLWSIAKGRHWSYLDAGQ